jgi:dTDP-glucose 4,6-dehydratase
MTLLVTGGAGFIGSNFIRYWLDAHPDDNIINFDILTYAGNLENLAELSYHPRYTFIYGDIRNREAVKAAMSRCDVVVHFAAESHVDRSITGPEAFVLTNVIGTQVLLDAARELKIERFHHISTDEVFGALPLNSSKRFTVSTPYNPRSPYSASKAASDHLVRAYAETYNLPVTISNCSNNYGPYHYPEKFIPLAITNLLEGKKVPVYGDGLYVRDWLHAVDHARAIDLILHDGKVGETYLIGGHGEKSNKEVVELLLDAMGKSEKDVEHVKDRPGHDRRYAIDPESIEALGWKPSVSFEQGLQETIEWFKANESWWKPLKSKG